MQNFIRLSRHFLQCVFVKMIQMHQQFQCEIPNMINQRKNLKLIIPFSKNLYMIKRLLCLVYSRGASERLIIRRLLKRQELHISLRLLIILIQGFPRTSSTWYCHYLILLLRMQSSSSLKRLNLLQRLFRVILKTKYQSIVLQASHVQVQLCYHF